MSYSTCNPLGGPSLLSWLLVLLNLRIYGCSFNSPSIWNSPNFKHMLLLTTWRTSPSSFLVLLDLQLTNSLTATCLRTFWESMDHMPKSPISSSFSGSTPTSSHKKVRPAAYSDSTDSKMAWKYWACWHLVPKRPKWGNWDNSGRTLGIVIRTHKKVWGWRFTFQKRPWSTISTQKFGKTWKQQVKSHLIHQIRWVTSCLGIHVFTDGYFEERFVKPICPFFRHGSPLFLECRG